MRSVSPSRVHSYFNVVRGRGFEFLFGGWADGRVIFFDKKVASIFLKFEPCMNEMICSTRKKSQIDQKFLHIISTTLF